jgi:hypothetical protein
VRLICRPDNLFAAGRRRRQGIGVRLLALGTPLDVSEKQRYRTTRSDSHLAHAALQSLRPSVATRCCEPPDLSTPRWADHNIRQAASTAIARGVRLLPARTSRPGKPPPAPATDTAPFRRLMAIHDLAKSKVEALRFEPRTDGLKERLGPVRLFPAMSRPGGNTPFISYHSFLWTRLDGPRWTWLLYGHCTRQMRSWSSVPQTFGHAHRSHRQPYIEYGCADV